MDHEHYIVDSNLQDLRIDKYLHMLMPQSSRAFIQKLLKEEKILVNGKSVKSSYKVQENDSKD